MITILHGGREGGDTYFFPYLFFLRYMISNIGKSTHHVNWLYSDGKVINLKLNQKMSQSRRFFRLLATLIIVRQAPQGIVGPGSWDPELVLRNIWTAPYDLLPGYDPKIRKCRLHVCNTVGRFSFIGV